MQTLKVVGTLAVNDASLESDVVYGYVGSRLRQLRVANGYTQADIARVLGVSPQQYHKYEDAKSKCSLNYLMKLAEYYRVRLESILPVDESAESSRVDAQIRSTPTSEADQLGRLISAFVQISSSSERWRLVQLIEAMSSK